LPNFSLRFAVILTDGCEKQSLLDIYVALKLNFLTAQKEE
jgi:hypothetical protein